MELKNEFRVGVPVAEAWQVLTDIERIAPCMPGAELYEIEDDEYHGLVKVKVGPITAQYRGKAFFLDRDDSAYRATLRAEGRDNRGQGNANATITAQLTEEGDATRVQLDTDLAITGKVAQFGRGVLSDVSVKLLNQFVQCLEQDVLTAVSVSSRATASVVEAPAPTPAAPEPKAEVEPEPAAEVEPELVPVPEPEPEVEPEPVGAVAGNGAAEKPKELAPAAPVRKVTPKPVEPVDLLGTAGAPVAKRVLPAVAAAVVVVVLVRRWRRNH